MKVNLIKNKMRGFTLVEIMIVVAVLAIMSVLGLDGYQAWIRASNVDNSAYMIERDILAGANMCFRTNRTYTGCLTAPLITNGVAPKTAWGGAWAAVVAGNIITITYPVPSEADGAALVSKLNASLSPHVGVAVYADPNVTVPLTMP